MKILNSQFRCKSDRRELRRFAKFLRDLKDIGPAAYQKQAKYLGLKK